MENLTDKIIKDCIMVMKKSAGSMMIRREDKARLN